MKKILILLLFANIYCFSQFNIRLHRPLGGLTVDSQAVFNALDSSDVFDFVDTVFMISITVDTVLSDTLITVEKYILVDMIYVSENNDTISYDCKTRYDNLFKSFMFAFNMANSTTDTISFLEYSAISKNIDLISLIDFIGFMITTQDSEIPQLSNAHYEIFITGEQNNVLVLTWLYRQDFLPD